MDHLSITLLSEVSDRYFTARRHKISGRRLNWRLLDDVGTRELKVRSVILMVFQRNVGLHQGGAGFTAMSCSLCLLLLLLFGDPDCGLMAAGKRVVGEAGYRDKPF